MDEINKITEKIIGCAIEVHRNLGPGLLESVYEEAMRVEFDIQGINYQRQVTIPVNYKGRIIGEYRLDLLVEDAVVVDSRVWNGMIRYSKHRS